MNKNIPPLEEAHSAKLKPPTITMEGPTEAQLAREPTQFSKQVTTWMTGISKRAVSRASSYNQDSNTKPLRNS